MLIREGFLLWLAKRFIAPSFAGAALVGRAHERCCPRQHNLPEVPGHSAAREAKMDNHGDTLRILLASDVHLGINERDPIRKGDARVTFEEIFQLANTQNVDMVLLTGNLFHENKPSRMALKSAIEVLRNHCLGDREIGMQIVSEQGASFHGTYRTANYEDPNYNVQLPVFAIHGDHDDPGGEGGLSALDILSSANLINYFGKTTNSEKISLPPLLIRKGASTRVALYGLGHMRDEQLTRALERKEVSVGRPEKDGDRDWFNLLAIHQNRARSAAAGTSAIKDVLLPSNMDIVIWGHERECNLGGGMDQLPDAKEVQFSVLHPGAAVATELSDAESKPKSVAILSINGDAWKLEPHPLTTVRPFLVKDVVLRECDEEEDRNLHNEEELRELLAEQVEAMLDELHARNEATPMTEHAESCLKFPLVRLRVDYTGYSTTNPQRFGQRFVDRVANPSSMLHFYRKPKPREAKAGDSKDGKRGAGSSTFADDGSAEDAGPAAQLQDLVGDFLSSTSKEQLRLLPQNILDRAVFERFVGKEEKDAITKQVDFYLGQTQKRIAKELAEAEGGFDRNAARKEQEAVIDQMVKKRADEMAAAAAAGRKTAADADDAAAAPNGAAHSSSSAAAASGRSKSPLGDGFDQEDDMFAADDGADAAPDDGMDDNDGGGEEAAAAAKPRGRGAAKQPAAAAKASTAGKAKAPSKPKAAPAAKAATGRGRGRGAAASGRGGRQTTLNVTRDAPIAIDDSDDDGGGGGGGTFDDGFDDDDTPKKSAGAGKRKVASAAGVRPKRAKAAARQYNDDDDDDDDDDVEEMDDEYMEAPAASKRSVGSKRRMR